jgi:glycosyltransferase involved in cell wall biosynthesis
MQNKFTVIIPTRERADTLLYALQTCIAQDYENLEILVCDNASQDGTYDVVHSFNDSRIKYINSGRRISMMENFELAFSHVSSGYVYSMGDDDGLTRQSISKVNAIINSTHCRAVTSDFAHYMWPSVDSSAAGQLLFSAKESFQVRDASDDLKQVLYGRRPFNHVPCIYYGYIHTDLINQLRQQHGRLFLTNVIDVFSSVALCSMMKNYVFSSEPLAINGTSSRSNGAAFLQITKDDTEKNRWYTENQTTSLPPFVMTGSIKMMLAEACYALENSSSSLVPTSGYDYKKMFKQACHDAYLYPKSKIELDLLKNIASQLGYHNIEVSELSNLFSKFELYAQRLPKFLNSQLICASDLGATNGESAAVLLQASLENKNYINLAKKIELLLNRFIAVRGKT